MKISVVPDSIDNAPVSNLAASVLVEQGQTVTYNVLADWSDPDGDAMQLTSASVASGDSVRFTPDGYITFRSVSELGVKTVSYTVQDSSSAKKTATGTLTVDVKAPGSTVPLAESDYASGFVGEPIEVSPLLNDRSPSGQTLHLLSVKEVVGSGPAPVPNLDKGTIQFNENQPGSYEFEYTETAGTSSKVNDAFIRVDAVTRPTTHVPPVAVSDVAYLTYPGTVTVPVLDNDISPEGLVLGVQSISAPSAPGVTAQLQSNTSIKVTATGASAGDRPVVINYTISDGTASSTASLTVGRGVPAGQSSVSHRRRRLRDRARGGGRDGLRSRQRRGSGRRSHVARADPRPAADGRPRIRDWQRRALPGAGHAGPVRGRLLGGRHRGGEQHRPRRVHRDAGNAEGRPGTHPTAGRLAGVRGRNRPRAGAAGRHRPRRRHRAAAVHRAESAARQDPRRDLDVLRLPGRQGIVRNGRLQLPSADPFGKTAIASASIGVMPRAGLLPPTAVDDSATLKPGTHATVDVLANDSDPNGYAISVEPKSLVNLGAKGVAASVVDNNVVLSAQRRGSGTTASGIRSRTVMRSRFPPSSTSRSRRLPSSCPPVAVDHILQQKDVASGKNVNVNARAGAQDPSGVVSSLGVSLAGVRSSAAQVSGGHIVVTPGKTALTIGYTLTDARTHLTSTAFILVPPVPKAGWNLAPYIRKDLKQQIVEIDTPTKFALADIVTAPSGKLPVIIDKGSLTATHGTVAYTDSGDFTFTPAKDYAGPAAITFDAADAAHPAHSAILTLPVTVGDPSGKDLKPTFTTIQTQVAQSATTPINLINATGNSKYVTYTVTGGNSSVTAHTSGAQGGTLEVAVADDAQEGSTVVFDVTLTTPSPSNYVIHGQVVVKIVSSLAPLAQAVTDTAHIRRGVTTTIDALANDVNPFPGTPLKITNVTIDNSAAGATFSNTSSNVTITPARPSSATSASTTRSRTRRATLTARSRARSS
ncbi:MAG: Ig-like domain-containing protein [Galbitalea sp.]